MHNITAMNSRILFIALVAGCAGYSAAQASTLASSTFDTGLDGWTSNTPTQISFQSTGGNPGGYIQFNDATGASTVVFAPAAFLGNYLSEGVASISFDDNIIAETGVSSVGRYEIDLSGPGGSASFFGAQPSTTYPTGWVNVDASITDATTPPTGWHVNSGTWQGLLANVTELEIPIELVTNDEIPGDTDVEGIDNVTLKNGVASAPEPSTVWLLAFGVVLGYAVRRIRRSPASL